MVLVFTGKRDGSTGDGKDLGSRSRMAREASAGKNSGGRLEGEMYRWMNAPQLVMFGVRSGCNI